MLAGCTSTATALAPWGHACLAAAGGVATADDTNAKVMATANALDFMAKIPAGQVERIGIRECRERLVARGGDLGGAAGHG